MANAPIITFDMSLVAKDFEAALARHHQQVSELVEAAVQARQAAPWDAVHGRALSIASGFAVATRARLTRRELLLGRLRGPRGDQNFTAYDSADRCVTARTQSGNQKVVGFSGVMGDEIKAGGAI